MCTTLKILIFLLTIPLANCDKENQPIKFHLNSFDTNKYYSEEIIPSEYQLIYGKWKLYNISGGFTGGGYDPDFDYLEIKSIGIYGLVRNDTLFEYGKIELDTFDNNIDYMLQVKLIPEYHKNTNPYISIPEKFINIKNDTLGLVSPCCDMYNYYFKRIK